MTSPTEISISRLNRLIGTPEAPVIIDVCIDEDFNADSRFIPGSFRHAFNDIEALLPVLTDKKVVVVCQKGLKLSQGTAAILRHHGIQAETLEGGKFAWRDGGLPLVPARAFPAQNREGRTVWVTRQRPKIDRIACPWLIRRFVDPHAMFLFVEPSQVEDVADRFSATPFDVDGVFWSHGNDDCTFDTMISEFCLDTAPLKQLARIVRGADTNKHDLAPEAAGLLAASLGLSRMFRDDIAQLDAGMVLYDAFYRWCRDAMDEGHDWPAASVNRGGKT